MLIPLGILASAGGEAGDYELIATEILGSATPSVTFDNLGDYSSTYKHLQIRAVARSTNAGIVSNIGVQFNGNTSGYFWHEIQGNGTTGAVESDALLSQTSMRLGMTSGATAAANAFSPTVIDLLDAYSTTKNKTFRGLTGVAEGPRVRFTSGSYASTDSVTEIKLLDLAANFVTGSRFSIYGVRG